MPLSGILSIARQGLTASQRALNVTSNNIANVNTPGYTRQRPVFEAVAPTTSVAGFPLGGGVDVPTIERVIDLTLESQLQRERQQFARDQTLEAGLTRAEGIVEQLAGGGLSEVISGFFASLNELANDPSDTTIRGNVIQTAQTLVTRLHDTDSRLGQLQVDMNEQIRRTADEVSEIARGIADLNFRIFRRGGDDSASTLKDQRSALLSELGEKIDFTSIEREDGQVAVYVAGGTLLVDGQTAGQLIAETTQPTPLPEPFFVNLYSSIDGVQAGPITDRIYGGELGGAIELRDRLIEQYRHDLDQAAFTLADRVNQVHAAGRGLDDATSRDFFTLGAPVEGAAGSIEINTELVANARHIAAGTPAAGAADEGDNRNALLLASLENALGPVYEIGDVLGTPTGPAQTVGAFVDSLAGRIGTDVGGSRRSLVQQELILAELEERRGAVSGVSIDEEVTNLIQFQRAFQANARVIQSVDEMLQQLLQI